MSTSERYEFASRLEMLERKYRHVRIAGLAFLSVTALFVFSAQIPPRAAPAPAGTVEVRKIVFVDGSGNSRAQLKVEDGPFLVAEMLEEHRGGFTYAKYRRQRVVPPLDEVSPDILEQIAEQIGLEATEVIRSSRRYRTPLLVLSDSDARPYGVVEALEIDSKDPYAKKWLTQRAKSIPPAFDASD